jgi:hypothetical protein
LTENNPKNLLYCIWIEEPQQKCCSFLNFILSAWLLNEGDSCI